MDFVYNAGTMLELRDKLSAVSAVAAVEHHASFTIDGRVPQVVVKPCSAEEVAAALAVCSRHRAPGVVWGGGTHVQTRAPIQRYEWAMDMRGLSRLLDYSPGDLVAVVEAGMTLRALQDLLQPYRQWLPIDAPLPDVQTLGGIVASQGAGLYRQRYGLPREWLLAVRAVLPTGESVKAGVGVVKNVAGYDLPRLFAGSWGTLGVLLELTFKLAPLPEVRNGYRASLPSAQALFDLRDALSHPLLQLEMTEVVYESGSGWQATCGLAGFEEDVRWQYNLLCERAPLEWALVTDGEVNALRDRYLLADTQCRCRCVVPPADVAELMTWINSRFPDADLQAHFGAGVVRVWWREVLPEASSLKELRQETQRLGGFCILEQAPVEIKHVIGVWGGVDEAVVAVMRRLKGGFDPHGILVGGLVEDA